MTVEVGDRVAAGLEGGAVDHVHQRGAALDVAQEVVAETAALAGALDQAGHVGHGEGDVTADDDAEVGDQRGERVVGDLGPGARDRGDQRRLAGARVADQADVGDDLELEGDGAFGAVLAEQGEAGGLARGGGERRVAETAATALGDDQLGLGSGQVGEALAGVGVGDHGPVGDRQHDVVAVGPVLVVAAAGLAAGRAPVGLAVVVDERGHVGVDAEDDGTAVTAVAAVGAAERLELLAVDGGAAVPAVPAEGVQRHLVDEAGDGHAGRLLSGVRSVRRNRKQREGGPGRATLSTGRTWSGRSDRGDLGGRGAPRDQRDVDDPAPTTGAELDPPARSAKRVSSLPRPTPSPGWKWVPRWRTMISPALTCWPPKRLTPRRWALDSRPLRVELAPFLCAICRLSSRCR